MSNLLAKLNPNGANLTGLPGGAGPEITAAEVSAALSVIQDPLQYHLLLARGADLHPNTEQAEIVLKRVRSILVELWVRGAGNARLDRDRLSHMALAIWQEVVLGGYTDTERAALVKMNRVSWSRNRELRELYRQTYAEIEGMYFDGVRKISKKIG